jgi:hypothetical protein
MRLLRNPAVSLAHGENVDVVTNSPLVALCRSRLPKKSLIAPEPMLLPGGGQLKAVRDSHQECA